MNKPLKFRYASELAGGLVLLSAALAVLGIAVTGRTQGWFERSFTLHTKFDTPKGSFGLREGNEVIIMNAAAGRVGKIVPTEQGHLSASFILKERFRQFVRQGSVAKVKKKFGVAGDCFVEIEVAGAGPGVGRVVSDGDYIQCLKDEEIMETAQKALKNVQGVALPMLKEVQEILGHANAILALLESGEGTAGALLHDPALARDLKGVVADARMLLGETHGTFREATRLVKAAQKHWLFRKHVEEKPDNIWLTPATYRGGRAEQALEEHEPLLERARAADDPVQIARNACNLAVSLLSAGDPDAALPYLTEARAELNARDLSPALTFLVEAEAMRVLERRSAAFAAARRAAELFKKADDGDGHLEARLMLAGLHCDAGNGEEAGRALEDVRKAVKKTESRRLRALAFGMRGRVHLLAKEYSRAASAFDEAAAALQADASYARMAEALAEAANAHALADAALEAADRYFRSARTLVALGNHERGAGLLAKSEAIANQLDDKDLQKRIRTISQAAAAPGPDHGKKE